MFMRYSVLVSLIRMSETLLNAKKYLQHSLNEELKKEIFINGKTIIVQIKTVLLQNKKVLRSLYLVDLICEIEKQWENGRDESDIEEYIYRFIYFLPREISYRVRAVFFAEIGEKWDSMNSVYQFMRNDSRFDPIVVLTPVFRITKTQEDEVEYEIIYKDYLTEMNIPFLSCDKYDIQQDRPDLAFICQPYKDATVQKFWPEELSKFTRLVYLPYYVPHIIEQTTKMALCELLVYAYAWRVVGVNQKHFEYYSRYSYRKGANMRVTGLPKTDALVHLNQRGVPLPDSWKKISGKKSILWNTWYILDSSSFQFFDEIVEWFCTHKECALIWRPHPMTEVVMKLNCPESYQRFREAIGKVSELENGVVDKEVSCEPAFFYSHAQMSDYSSLLVQYIFMDKPLLWIKNDEWEIEKEEFVGSQWIEDASNITEIVLFLESVRCGEDKKSDLRKMTRQRDLPLADGHCGERICNMLWNELHDEDVAKLKDK